MPALRLGLLLLSAVLLWEHAGFLSRAAADISLPKVFSDNMVLQRNSKVRIYGGAEKGQKLSVQLAGKTQKVTADQDGNWSIDYETGAAGGPYELIVAAEAGEPQVKLSNIMFGEVWVCSGQSNMQWPVKSVLNSKTEIEKSINYPNIRLFTVEPKSSLQPLERFEKVTGWEVCSPDSIGPFSGAAYFFARELSKKFPDLPIGLVNASWGGTSCEAWTSRKSLEQVGSLKPLLDHWDAISTEEDKNRPSVLFNGMIHPLKRFTFRGVIWYQGERNNGRGQQYATLLPTLIKDWRTFFGNTEMPFYFVQIAPFRYPQQNPAALPEIWEAQLKTAANVPNTAMVTTTDIGNVDDIHPKNKQEVGRRLSLVALARLYQEELPEDQREIVASGPIYQNMSTNGSRIRLTFRHAKGLRIRGNGQALDCFEICGADNKFYPAAAQIVGETVEVESSEVTKPKAVRFGWTDTAQPNLINGAGLPAAPFRTDQLPLLSEGRDF